MDKRERIIRRVAGIQPGETLVTTLASGMIESQVLKTVTIRRNDTLPNGEKASQEAIHDNG